MGVKPKTLQEAASDFLTDVMHRRNFSGSLLLDVEDFLGDFLAKKDAEIAQLKNKNLCLKKKIRKQTSELIDRREKNLIAAEDHIPKQSKFPNRYQSNPSRFNASNYNPAFLKGIHDHD